MQSKFTNFVHHFPKFQPIFLQFEVLFKKGRLALSLLIILSLILQHFIHLNFVVVVNGRLGLYKKKELVQLKDFKSEASN